MPRRSVNLPLSFFDQPAVDLAPALLGKVIRHNVNNLWLSARIIETEAYEVTEGASHSSLGRTHARRAMFMPPGTIYMYYARGADSLNFSAAGDGDAVLIKSAIALTDDATSLRHMLRMNPIGNRERPIDRLCSGQTLLCKSLGLKVTEWNAQLPHPERLKVEDDGYQPSSVLRGPRLGIPAGRDEHLPYRFIDEAYAASATKNPLSRNAGLHPAFRRISSN
jgi:DNA-3-methyladenine glycosylase